jgi:site-specific recombinase XerD
MVAGCARETGSIKRVNPHLLRHLTTTMLLDSGAMAIDEV